MSRRLFFVGISGFAIAMLTQGAQAQEWRECSYALSNGEHQSFVQRKNESDDWLKRMAADHSIPNFDSKAECHETDSNRVWHLLSKSQNGTVSLLSNLTQAECYEAQDGIVKRSDGMVMPGDIFWNDTRCFK